MHKRHIFGCCLVSACARQLRRVRSSSCVCALVEHPLTLVAPAGVRRQCEDMCACKNLTLRCVLGTFSFKPLKLLYFGIGMRTMSCHDLGNKGCDKDGWIDDPLNGKVARNSNYEFGLECFTNNHGVKGKRKVRNWWLLRRLDVRVVG